MMATSQCSRRVSEIVQVGLQLAIGKKALPGWPHRMAELRFAAIFPPALRSQSHSQLFPLHNLHKPGNVACAEAILAFDLSATLFNLNSRSSLRYDVLLQIQQLLFRFSFSHSVKIVAPYHYYMINATQGSLGQQLH